MRTRSRAASAAALSGLLASVVALSGCGTDESEPAARPEIASPWPSPTTAASTCSTDRP